MKGLTPARAIPPAARLSTIMMPCCISLRSNSPRTDSPMSRVIDPVTGVHLYELSNPWGYNIPMWPAYDDVKLERISRHGRHGVMTQKLTAVFHASTHVNAPVHLVPGAQGVGQIALERFFGTAVVLGIPRGKWGQVTSQDLEAASPEV